jgi:hypothetical protein
MFHTIYDSFESKLGGRDYIGKHSTENPYDDYKGSFRDKTFEPDSKIIVGYSKTAEGAVWLEIQWQKVFEVAEDPQFANRSYQTSTKFNYDRTGVPHSEETVRKIKTSNKETFKNNPKERKRRSEAVLGDNNPSRRFPETKEQKEVRLEAVRKAWADPETRKKQSELQKRLQNDPETNKKRSKSIKEALDTPEEKERRRKESLGRNWYSNREGQRKFCKIPPGEGWKPGYFWEED